jgi:hypothetical protein
VQCDGLDSWHEVLKFILKYKCCKLHSRIDKILYQARCVFHKPPIQVDYSKYDDGFYKRTVRRKIK